MLETGSRKLEYHNNWRERVREDGGEQAVFAIFSRGRGNRGRIGRGDVDKEQPDPRGIWERENDKK